MLSCRANVIQANLSRVMDRIHQVSTDPYPLLIAVSKKMPVADILHAYESGHRHFGENYIDELDEKASQCPLDIHWHYIGVLQSNKLKLLSRMPNLDSVQTLHSMAHAIKLNALIGKDRPHLPLNVYIQVNTSAELQKNGIEAHLDSVSSLIRGILAECPFLKVRGLMTIGSLQSSHASSVDENDDFRKMIELKKALLQAQVMTECELSMGMSLDFETAIRMGSNIVRVGSDIFGSRG